MDQKVYNAISLGAYLRVLKERYKDMGLITDILVLEAIDKIDSQQKKEDSYQWVGDLAVFIVVGAFLWFLSH